MNKQYPPWNLWNCPIHWFNNSKVIPCKCNKNPNCKICHGFFFVRKNKNEHI